MCPSPGRKMRNNLPTTMQHCHLGLNVFDLLTEEEMALVGRLLFLPTLGCWMNTHSVFVSASTAGEARGKTKESVFSLITNSSSSFTSSSSSDSSSSTWKGMPPSTVYSAWVSMLSGPMLRVSVEVCDEMMVDSSLLSSFNVPWRDELIELISLSCFRW